MSDLLEQLEIQIADGILERIIPEISQRLHEQAKKTEICFTEAEAAEKLKIAKESLARLRKNGEINYTYALMPTFNKGRVPKGGRVVYLASHLYDYLLKREIRNGVPKITLHEVLGGSK